MYVRTYCTSTYGFPERVGTPLIIAGGAIFLFFRHGGPSPPSPTQANVRRRASVFQRGWHAAAAAATAAVVVRPREYGGGREPEVAGNQRAAAGAASGAAAPRRRLRTTTPTRARPTETGNGRDERGSKENKLRNGATRTLSLIRNKLTLFD